MRERFTKEEIWSWYNNRPWINGSNYRPANASLKDYYTPDTHEAAKKAIAEEVKLAASMGLNSFRMHLPRREWWRANRKAVLDYFEEFLCLLDENGIDLMVELFSDCVPSKPDENGNSISCFDGKDVVGWMPEDDPACWPEAEEWVMDFAGRYKNDKRICIWNIWNEAGNAHRDKDMLSLPFIKRLYQLLRENDVSQPLTTECWGLYKQVEGRYNFKVGLDPLEREVCNLSDIITFHYYGDLLHTKAYFKFLAKEFERPMLNTEWGHRPWGSFIPSHLPLFKKYNVGSYFFGFVTGKYFDMTKVWNWIANDDRIDTSLWMHGIFYDDFTPYDQDDIDALLEMKAILEKENAEKFGTK